MRVVAPLFNAGVSGGIRVAFAYLAGLAERGHMVTVLTTDGNGPRYLSLGSGVQHYRVAQRALGVRLGYLGLSRALVGAAPACDLVLAASWQCMLPGWWLHLRDRAPVMLLAQGWLPPRRGLSRLSHAMAEHLAYRLPATRVAVSPWVASGLRRRYGVSSTVVPNGVDRAAFAADGPRLGLDALPGTQWVMVLARKAPPKGFQDALEAIRIARQANSAIRGLFVGQERLPTPQDIPYHWVMPANDSEMSACYRAADVLLHASRQEGFGLPPLEAMACGLPVVLADSGGVRAYCLDGRNCLMTPPGDPHALARALLEVLSSGELAGSLVREGFKTAERFDVVHSVAQFCDLAEATAGTA